VSGGSYGYLFSRARALDDQRDELVRMAERLEGLPYAQEAATDTRRVIALIDEANGLAYRLSAVWHDVEWWDSGDYGEHSAREVCQEYRELTADPMYWVQS